MSEYEWSQRAWPVLGTSQVPTAEIHRGQIMTRLLEAAPVSGGRLCILGAGPCNDLDLAALQGKWPHVDLVDIDAGRVQQGIAAQVADARGLRVIAQDLLWGDRAVTPASTTVSTTAVDLQQMFEHLSTTTWPAVDRDYDGIASTCLLSQLIEPIIERVGSDSPEFVRIVQALRRRHFELMARALRPGGIGWIFCDFVSSQTVPELLTTASSALPPLLKQALAKGNFFHGLNPGILLQVLRQDAPLSSLISQPKITNPWVWLTGGRGYAVVGLCFTRL
jgi:hypothetical protein